MAAVKESQQLVHYSLWELIQNLPHDNIMTAVCLCGDQLDIKDKLHKLKYSSVILEENIYVKKQSSMLIRQGPLSLLLMTKRHKNPISYY